MAGRILVAEHDGVYMIKFEDDVRLTLCATVDDYLDSMFADDNFRGVVVDLNDTSGIDSTSLGLLAKLSIQAEKRFGFVPTLVCTNPDITRILLSMGFDDVFDIIDGFGFPWWVSLPLGMAILGVGLRVFGRVAEDELAAAEAAS